MAVRVSVVIPTHNRSDALEKTLINLSRQEFDEKWEVVVVNNRSTDDTDEVVRRQEFPVPLRLVHEAKPGVAAARNSGAREAVGQYIVFLDNDILVEMDFLRRHYDALKLNPGCWVLGQVVNLPEQESTPFGKFRMSLYPYLTDDSGIVEAHWLTGQIFSLSRSDWEQLGGFDEIFSGASVEDFDLALRAWERGIRILFYPDIVGVHNDWAGFSIRDYCRRQRMYTQVEPLFWYKHGKEYPRPNLVHENMPPSWQRDNTLLMLRKLAKRLVGTRIIESSLFGLCSILERFWPSPVILWRLYRALLAAAIYKGFQEGLEMHRIDLQKREDSRKAPAALI